MRHIALGAYAASNKNNSKKKKPRQGPNLDKAFGSNINDIISNFYTSL